MKYKMFDLPYSSHNIILKNIGNRKKVLDVGCASGYLGKVMKKKGCYVAGLDIDKNYAKKAKAVLDKVIVCNIEEIEKIPFKDGFFDFIVCADILEHLRDPKKVLLMLRRCLSRKGYIIVSVPNVAHILNRKDILLGRWEYKDTGILDRTHLKFFTLRTAKELIRDAGYEIVDIKPSGKMINTLNIKRLMPLLASQFIITAKNKFYKYNK